MGPTSSADHGCSQKRTPGQGSVYRNRTDQGSTKLWQSTARPGYGEWPVMDTAALRQAVGALHAHG